MDMLPVVLKPSHSFDGTDQTREGDEATRLETIATQTFFNNADDNLEEEAVGSLFELPALR